MTFMILLTLLYFLPAILAHNKRHALAIFLVNFLTGWTIVGWFIALIWAIAADPRPIPTVARIVYCTHCGTPQFMGPNFCPACGRRLYSVVGAGASDPPALPPHI